MQLLNGEYVIVEQVQHELLETPVTVYNFEVEDFHTYYVTDSGVLVHNRCHGNEFPDDGIPNSSKLRYGQNGKIRSAGTYGPNGKLVAKIHFQGIEHYVKSVGKRIIPHVHPMVNNNGFLREGDAITILEYLSKYGG